jgi:hypothetical protein
LTLAERRGSFCRSTVFESDEFVKLRLMSLALLVALTTASVALAEPSVFPTGTTRYDPARAYGNYVLFSGSDNVTHLIDADGNEVHRWPYPGFPSGLIDPKLVHDQRGHVLVQYAAISGAATGAVPGQPALFRNRTIAELDWDGKVVWQWGPSAPGGAAKQHHDWERLPNGNTLVLANLLHPVAGFRVPAVLDDVVYEVTPAGDIVWKWVASEHLNELGLTPSELQLVRNTKNPDYLHVNDMTALGPNKWFRAGDTRFNPDNVLIDSRNANFVIIIDKTTGHVVWRLGPDYPAVAKNQSLPAPVDQLSGQHDARLIPDGLPGAGDLLLFDNQGEAGYPPVALNVNGGSRVLEINPVDKTIVWRYTAADSNREGWTFYSSFISDAQRLPNGNTFIDEGMNGRFFQVTPAGEIVWEYVSPYFGNSLSAGGSTISSNAVYRAQPVPYDWVPADTPHFERAVTPPNVATFRIPVSQ